MQGRRSIKRGRTSEIPSSTLPLATASPIGLPPLVSPPSPSPTQISRIQTITPTLGEDTSRMETEEEGQGLANVKTEEEGTVETRAILNDRARMVTFSKAMLQSSTPSVEIQTLYTAPATRKLSRMSGSLTLTTPRGNGEFGTIYIVIFHLDAVDMVTSPSTQTLIQNFTTDFANFSATLNFKGQRSATMRSVIPRQDVVADAFFTTQSTPTQQKTQTHPFTRKMRYWMNKGERLMMAAVYQRFSPSNWGTFFGTTIKDYPGITVHANLSYSVKR